jgi:FHA domain/zinc-ribbon domain
VIWRRRRNRVQATAAAVSGQHATGSGDRAWRMDQRPPTPVAWSASAEVSRPGVRTDVYAAMTAAPTNRRLGGQMPSVYCTGCGEANPETARFCSQCGTPLIRAAGERAPAETTSMIFTGAEPAELDSGDESVADADALDALLPGTALLVVRRGPNAGSRFLLDSPLTEVGRRPDSDIFLDDVTVSRRHAEFYRDGGRFAVRDVGSLNGTYVNRERIEEAALSGGDEVQIGKFRLVFLQGHRTHAESGG